LGQKEAPHRAILHQAAEAAQWIGGGIGWRGGQVGQNQFAFGRAEPIALHRLAIDDEPDHRPDQPYRARQDERRAPAERADRRADDDAGDRRADRQARMHE